jgi:A/G-specific adenine glycosylase
MPHRPSEDPTRRLDVPSLRAALLAFFDRERRDLPWRRTGDPYAIWVSEVMLQQTRVETAGPYYERWMQAFPTVQALANAPEDRVLKLWEGLGYYSRARNLHRAARIVRDTAAGTLPESAAELRKLPGIGPYTAGAVASIAFGEAAPAVDGNVRRVLARLFDVAHPRPSDLERWAAHLVDPTRPGDFNQALMELGSLVCTPQRPDCTRCALHAWCAARANDTVAERPAPIRRSPVVSEHRGVLVAAARDPDAPGSWSLRVERRSRDGLLGGLWAFPDQLLAGPDDPVKHPPDPTNPRSTPAQVAAHAICAARGLTPGPHRPLEPVRHRFSHRDVTYRPTIVVVGTERAPVESAIPSDQIAWLRIDAEPRVALPVAQQRIFEAAREQLTGEFGRTSPAPPDS